MPKPDEDLQSLETENCVLSTLVYHSGAVNCVRFSPDGRYLASCGDDNTILLFELRAGPATGFGQKNVENWRNADLSRVHKSGASSYTCLNDLFVCAIYFITFLDVVDLSWSPEGSHLASIGHDGVIALHRVENGKLCTTSLEFFVSIAFPNFRTSIRKELHGPSGNGQRTRLGPNRQVHCISRL